MSDNPEIATPSNPEIQHPISIKRSEVDLGAIQEQFRKMPMRRASTIIETMREMRNLPAAYINVLDLDNMKRKNPKEPRKPIIDKYTGSFIVDQIPEDNHFKQFFKKGRYFYITEEEEDRRTPSDHDSHSLGTSQDEDPLPVPRIDLKGPRALLGIEPYNSRSLADRLPTIEDKINIIAEDSLEAIETLKNFDRRSIQNESELKLYLATLDYLKTHAMTMFHILTYDERLLDITKINENPNHQQNRQLAMDYLIKTTRMFYLACLGQESDEEFLSDKLTIDLQKVIDCLPEYLTSDANKKFTVPDVLNPFVILLSSYRRAKQDPDRDLLVGIPSGGTESAIVTQLIFEKVLNRKPNLVLVPLSFHGGEKFSNANDPTLLATYLREIHPEFSDSKNALIIDDNSNTGTTLETMTDALISLGIRRSGISITELDTNRIIRKYGSPKKKYEKFFNISNPDTDTSAGIVPLNTWGQPVVVYRSKNRVSRWYQEDESNTLADRKI